MEKLLCDSLQFDEPTHVYSLTDEPQLELTSATTFIHRWFAPFEREKIAQKLISNVPKYANCTPEELYAEWKQSGISGTNVHAALEDFIIKFAEDGTDDYDIHLQKHCKTDVEIAKAKHGMEWLIEKVFQKKHLVLMPEVKVVSRDYKIAGMMDLLVHNTETDEYSILDWKTNKRISKTSYGDAKGIRYATEKIDDCNFMHYTLQLSLYRYILERDYGLKIKNQALIHLSEDRATVMQTEYDQACIVNMFQEAIKLGEIKW